MKTEYEKCMAGEPFIGSRDPKIVEMILRTKRLLAQFNATDYADSKRRRELLCVTLFQRSLRKRIGTTTAWRND